MLLVLAGNAVFELCAGGGDVLVDSSNLVSYIQAVVDATLGLGIEAQLQAFRDGFNEVSPMVDRLRCIFAGFTYSYHGLQHLYARRG